MRDWVDAGKLQPGDALLSASGGKPRVGAVRNFAGAQLMYNLTVTDTHTYYVTVGNTSLLAHNANADACTVDLYWNVDAAEFDNIADTKEFSSGRREYGR